MNLDDFAYVSASDLARSIRNGKFSAGDVIEACIARIEESNPRLGAITVTRFDRARQEAETAEGPFAGVPYVIKDHTLQTDGDQHTQGVRGLREAGLRGTFDSHFVTRMRSAGYVLVAKTNMPEMALGPTTEPLAWGPARNPWDLTRSTGGSSGGSAAAVAAGLVPVAEGSDGGGSGRMPAAHCGVVGLKPSRGRISSGPLVNAADNVHGMGTESLLSRTVADLAAMLDVVAGHEPGDAYAAPTPVASYLQALEQPWPRLRIGFLAADPTGRASIDDQSAEAVRAVAGALASAGHAVAENHPAALAAGPVPEEFLVCLPVIIAREIDRLGRLIGRQLTEHDVEPETWALLSQGHEKITGMQYSEGVDSLRRYQQRLEGWWEKDGWDILLTPTTPAPPPPLGASRLPGPASTAMKILATEAFTIPYNVSGQPALSLPLATARDGLPLGVQLVGRYGREDILLRLAAELEQILPWGNRRPAGT